MLIEGVKYNPETDSFVFDFNKDEPTDLLYLKYKPKTYITKGSFYRFTTYYGYQTNRTADKELIKKFFMGVKSKNKIKPSDYDTFVNKAIIGLEQNINVRDIDAIIIPSSSYPLLHDIANKIHQKTNHATLLKDLFVKNTIDNIFIDTDKLIKNAKTQEEVEKRKKILQHLKNKFNNQEFSIKKIPPRYRKFFSNFLTFGSDQYKRVYNSYTGHVLIIDDIMTSGETMKELLRQVDVFKPKSITIFTLIKNK